MQVALKDDLGQSESGKKPDAKDQNDKEFLAPMIHELRHKLDNNKDY